MMGHYDDCVSYSDPMVAAPGADDNASGVAALLESARVIMETGYVPRKTFIFLATAAEELMLMSDCGAMHYAGEAAAEGRDLSMVLNNDMISWNDSTWSIRFINDTNSMIATDLAIHILDTYTTLDRTFSSMGTFADLTYFLDEGYEGAYFMESVLNGFTPYYHTLNDVASNIDTAYLAEMTRLDLGCFLLSDMLENDAVLAGISRVPAENCTGLLSPVVSITNNGSGNLTSMDIVCRVNESDSAVFPWTGNLAFQETQQVELSAFPFALLPVNELEISLENVNGEEDELFLNNTGDVNFGVADAAPEEVRLKIRLDEFPQETTWDFKNSTGDIIYSGGPYSTPNSMVDETLVFDDHGCYTFTTYDAGGDGLQSGFVLLYYGTNSIILSVSEFESLVQTQFDVGGTLETEEITPPGKITCYPNPFHDEVTVSCPISRGNNVSVKMTDACGRKVQALSTKSPGGLFTCTIDTRALAPGLYLLELQEGDYVRQTKILKR
jgi:hypothetical protein